jgi:hypothetical protein
MAAIYSNGGNNWNILGFSLTKRDALSSVYKISMVGVHRIVIFTIWPDTGFAGYLKKFEYLTYNIYYKDFSHPCISAEDGDTIF